MENKHVSNVAGKLYLFKWLVFIFYCPDYILALFVKVHCLFTFKCIWFIFIRLSWYILDVCCCLTLSIDNWASSSSLVNLLNLILSPEDIFANWSSIMDEGKSLTHGSAVPIYKGTCLRSTLARLKHYSSKHLSSNHNKKEARIYGS